MSLRLRLLNAYLRHVVKPQLARTQDAERLRRGLRRGAALMPQPPAELFAPAPHIAERAARGPAHWWCAPSADRHGADGVVLFLHGGSYIAGSPETHRSLIFELAKAASAPVAAPDYRLAPEHPFPTAFDDAMAAFDALRRTVGPRAPIALAGDSAGGGLALAAAAALAARADGPAAVAVFSPFADLALTGKSLRRNARRETMLPTSRFKDAVDAYLAGADPRDPRASPLYAAWRAPPPTLIQASRAEALSDDAARMADALKMAGGDVKLEMWRTTPHAWHFFAPYLAEAADAVASAGRFLRARLDAAFAEAAVDGGAPVAAAG